MPRRAEGQACRIADICAVRQALAGAASARYGEQRTDEDRQRDHLAGVQQHPMDEDSPMTDQDEDQDQQPGKLGSKPTDEPVGGPTDVEAHGGPTARIVADDDDDDDVEGHFSTIRSTGSKGE